MSEINHPEAATKKFVFHIYENTDESNTVCGHCQPSLECSVREEFTQFLLLPCMNKEYGCSKRFHIECLKAHEKNCKYQGVICPSSIYTQCVWEGPRNLLSQHFEANHPQLIIEHPVFRIVLMNSNENHFLLKAHNEFFVAKMEVDSCTKSFSCTVDHLISKDVDKVYIYRLIVETSGQQLFESNKKNTDGKDAAIWSFQDLEETLISSVVVKVLLRDKSDILLETGELNEVTSDINWELLSEIECPVCYNFMIPKIFLCSMGHSICAECRPKVNICPTCRNTIGEARNYTLEKLTERIIYPCRHYKFGCAFSSKSTEIASHADSCCFRQLVCPLKTERDCSWTGFIAEMFIHIEIAHSESLLKNGTGTVHYPHSTHKLLILDKTVVKLFFNFQNNFQISITDIIP